MADVAERANVSKWQALRHALCPRCRKGPIFEPRRGLRLPHMYPYCPECGLKYEREHGYFLGAMYISYGLGLVVIAAFSAILWATTRLGFYRSILYGFLIFLPFAPALAVISRVLWIHFDRAVDPE